MDATERRRRELLAKARSAGEAVRIAAEFAGVRNLDEWQAERLAEAAQGYADSAAAVRDAHPRQTWENDGFRQDLPTCLLGKLLYGRPTKVGVFAGGRAVRNRDDANGDLHLFFSFLNQVNLGKGHLFVDCFTHVVNREQRDSDTGQGFHFDAGLRNRPRGATNFRAVAQEVDVDFNLAEWNRVTKRNELRRSLGTLNSGDFGGRHHVPLCDFVFADEFNRFFTKRYFTGGNRGSRTQRFR